MRGTTSLHSMLAAACFLCTLSACNKGDDHQARNPVQAERATGQAAPADKQATQQSVASPGSDPELEEALRIAEQMRREAEARQATSASGVPEPDPGIIYQPNPSENLDLQPIVGREILSYEPAVQADLDAGKLLSLLERHESACKKGDRIAFFSLFTQSVRFGFSKMPKQRLEQYFRNSCEEKALAQISAIKGESISKRFRIIETGNKKDGRKISTLCTIGEDDSCSGTMHIGVEDGVLKRAEW